MPTGSLMPIDVEPVEHGTVIVTTDVVGTLTGNQFPKAIVLRKGQPDLFSADQPRYVSHFATCPHADNHRKAKR
jgi:hypothetical protein